MSGHMAPDPRRQFLAVAIAKLNRSFISQVATSRIIAVICNG